MERIAARRAGGRLGDALEAGSRAAARRLLKLVRGGRITLVEGASRAVFGGGDAPACTVTVVRPRFYTALLRGSMAVARSHVAGDFDCDDLVSLTRIAARSAGPVASAAKFERACLRLELSPGDRVLEIGTGWGGFALHAASRFGCHVTTATISAEQHRHAVARVRDAGRCCS